MAWTLIDYLGANSTVMDEVWRRAAQPNGGRPVAFEARLALTLLHWRDGIRHMPREPLHLVRLRALFNPLARSGDGTLTFLALRTAANAA